MIQGKLGQLVGRSSGYIESLPPVVRRRVAGLKGIQKEHSKLEAQFQEEVLELEKKYFAKFTPLYERRSTIINGSAEPTEKEVEEGKEDEEEDEEDEETKESEKKEQEDESESPATGIPEFWLSAMKNQVSLAEMITDRDEEALKQLTDIRMEYLDCPGFRLIFEFAENEFFTNKTITKTYYYKDESGYGGDFIYDHAEGSKIDWKEEKDLTLRLESKKQRNKSMLNLAPCSARYNRGNFSSIIQPEANHLYPSQTPSRPALSRSACLPNLSSTSFPHRNPPPMRMTMTCPSPATSKSALSWTTSWARTLKRS
jgi:nucleosome assembly protein 1-like 1